MRRNVATPTVASLIAVLVIAVLTSAVAEAAPTQVNVRIEGREQTLFEGPILTEGHEIEASSDDRTRSCDGIDPDDPENVVPGPTPTAASVDAIGLLGETFDGQWSSQYDDYAITRWGPDEQRPTDGAYWGVVVNNVFPNFGGCQYELSGGDEVTWAYDAFASKPMLALYPAGSTSGARPLTALAQKGKPFAVEVLDFGDDSEGRPPAEPERAGSVAYAGADVSPVALGPKGFEKVETSSPATVTTNAKGKANVTFTTPGWHRIKATHLDGEGREDAIRSNRLDVCVPPEGEVECGRPPFEDEPRTPAYLEAELGKTGGSEEPPVKHEEASPGAGTQTGGTGGVAGFTATTAAGAVRIESARFDGRGAAQGLTGVSWRLADTGAGAAEADATSWAIASKTLAQKGAAYVPRASGSGVTSALVKLPPGRAYALELTVADRLGRATTATIGKVLVPEDDRWSGLSYAGQWHRQALGGAWHATVTAGRAGAGAAALLGAGRAVFELRRTSAPTKIELRFDSHRETFAVAGGPAGSLQLVRSAERAHAGRVSLRVLKGAAELDGVAVEP